MMMKKTLSIIIFILTSFLCFAQEKDTSNNQKFFLGIIGGLNFSKFNNDSINLNYGTRPAIGLYSKNKIIKNLNVTSSLLYSVKGSGSISPFLKFENTYIDLSVVPQYRLFNDFLYIDAGANYSNLLTSKKIIINGKKKNGIEKIEIEGFNSNLSIVAGIELKLQNNINIKFNYFIPTSKGDIKNFQTSLNILLNNKNSKKESYKHIRKSKSKEQIKRLKSGTLLVRLMTSESKINALIKLGKIEKANKVKQQQEIENRKIVSAFKNKFNFCNIAFFFSNQSNNVLNRKFDNIFLNDSLLIDNSISIDTNKSIFTAEFGAIEQDTSKYFSYYSYEQDGNWSLKKVDNYYSTSSDIDFFALIIKDENFIQLNKPFPYYTRTIYKSIKKHPEELLFIPPLYLSFLTWSYDRTVQRMNRKLSRYYKWHK